MDEVKIYLSGPVEKASDSTKWRDDITKVYSIDDDKRFLDPTKTELTPESSPDEVINTCMELMGMSDIVLINHTGEYSVGTWVEMAMAYNTKMPILVWDTSDMDELPKFLRGFSTILDEDIEYIMSYIKTYKFMVEHEEITKRTFAILEHLDNM